MPIRLEIPDDSWFWTELAFWEAAVMKVRKRAFKPGEETGPIGEFLVYHALKAAKKNPLDSCLDAESWFDQEKDGELEDGTTYEVKTSLPWYEQMSFAVAPNQQPKLQKVDFTHFVEVPFQMSDEVSIWALPRDNVQHGVLKLNPAGNGRLLFPFSLLDRWCIIKSRKLCKILNPMEK
jgi:hypothetical protein